MISTVCACNNLQNGRGKKKQAKLIKHNVHEEHQETHNIVNSLVWTCYVWQQSHLLVLIFANINLIKQIDRERVQYIPALDSEAVVRTEEEQKMRTRKTTENKVRWVEGDIVMWILVLRWWIESDHEYILHVWYI